MIKIIRIFNPYESNMNPEDRRTVSTFIVQVLKVECIYIFGDGLQTRPLIKHLSLYQDDTKQ